MCYVLLEPFFFGTNCILRLYYEFLNKEACGKIVRRKNPTSSFDDNPCKQLKNGAHCVKKPFFAFSRKHSVKVTLRIFLVAVKKEKGQSEIVFPLLFFLGVGLKMLPWRTLWHPCEARWQLWLDSHKGDH